MQSGRENNNHFIWLMDIQTAGLMLVVGNRGMSEGGPPVQPSQAVALAQVLAVAFSS